MLPTILGYLVIAQFFFLDRSRRGAEAKSFEAGQFDQRSTMYIGVAYLVSVPALLLSWLLNWLHVGALSGWVGWLGLAIALGGLFLRWYANRLLGAFYTRTLKVTENQHVIREGPYSLIRHPGYLGSLLMWVGVAAATSNWIVLLIVLTAMSLAYVYRIETEERMLLTTLPNYAEYRTHTWRLIPLLY